MSIFRSSAILLSSAFSLSLLTGCPNAGTQPAAPDLATSPTPAAQSAAPASPAASAPAGTASTAPTTTPSTSPLAATTLRGKVYDELGAAVTSAKVSVKSLNTANPFETTVDVLSGSYVVNDVPAGVQLEVTATRPGWTSRTRVETLLPLSSSQPNVLNFGGLTTDAEDGTGAAYFISKYPEIVSAVANRNGGDKLTYTIRLSEPLDETNRRRLESALTITAPDPNGGIILLRRSSAFLDDRIMPQLSWDAAGTTLTFEFAAPLRARNDDETTYTLALTRGESDELIKDADGNVLGMITPAPSSTYTEAFKLAALVPSATADAQARWAAAHTGSASFDVPKDDTKPVLASVTGVPITTGGQSRFRFSLTFSEPLRVYPQDTGFSTTVTDPNNYYFALSEESLDGVDMTGAASTVSTPGEAEAAVSSNNVFRFSGATVEFSSSDPKVVHVNVDRTLVPEEARFFKVRVDAVQDPAGNVISNSNKVDSNRTADNIKSGAI